MIRSAGLMAALSIAWLVLSAFTPSRAPADAENALDMLDRAARWGLSRGSVLDGARGFGGGLEYAVDESVCRLAFADRPSCDEIRGAVSSAFDRWAAGHPIIVFRDVSPSIQTDPTPGRGAEIDIVAVAGDRVRTIVHGSTESSLVLTNGVVATGPIERLESVDILIGVSECYYLNAEDEGGGCRHFPSLMLREAARAIGVGGPDAAPLSNLDTDDVAGNEIPIDCRSPSAGLKAAPVIDAAAAASGGDAQDAGRWRRGLTWDDAAARDALYPHCGITPRQRFGPVWGAFALSDSGALGVALSAPDAAAAEREAERACRRRGRGCRSATRFSGCFAVADDRAGVFAHAKAPLLKHAREDAVLACRERGGRRCRVAASACAFDDSLRP
ncbi:MAG: DUF4189 domain-containing protein [Pseudomonadota bacterium]